MKSLFNQTLLFIITNNNNNRITIKDKAKQPFQHYLHSLLHLYLYLYTLHIFSLLTLNQS